MATTNCPECGHTITTMTIRCPGCRHVDLRPIGMALFWLAVLAATVWYFYLR